MSVSQRAVLNGLVMLACAGNRCGPCAFTGLADVQIRDTVWLEIPIGTSVRILHRCAPFITFDALANHGCLDRAQEVSQLVHDLLVRGLHTHLMTQQQQVSSCCCKPVCLRCSVCDAHLMCRMGRTGSMRCFTTVLRSFCAVEARFLAMDRTPSNHRLRLISMDDTN